MTSSSVKSTTCLDHKSQLTLDFQKSRESLNPEQLGNSLARAEHFAIFLRKSKRKAIHLQKRAQLKISFEKKFMPVTQQNPEEAKKEQQFINPRDFIEVIETGVDFESLMRKLAFQLNNEEAMQTYLQENSQRDVNKLADWIVNLFPSVQSLETKKAALTILINITCLSINSCIFLANVCHGAIQKVLAELKTCPKEVCWLLIHILAEERIQSTHGAFEAQFLQILNQVSLDQAGIDMDSLTKTLVLVLRNLKTDIDRTGYNFHMIRQELATFNNKFMDLSTFDSNLILILHEQCKSNLVEYVPNLSHLLFSSTSELDSDKKLAKPIATIMSTLKQPLYNLTYLEQFMLKYSYPQPDQDQLDITILKILAFCMSPDQLLQSEVFSKHLFRCFCFTSVRQQRLVFEASTQVIYNHCQESDCFVEQVLLNDQIIDKLSRVINKEEGHVTAKSQTQLMELGAKARDIIISTSQMGQEFLNKEQVMLLNVMEEQEQQVSQDQFDTF